MKIGIKTVFWKDINNEGVIKLIDFQYWLVAISTVVTILLLQELSILIPWGLSTLFYVMIRRSYTKYEEELHAHKP